MMNKPQIDLWFPTSIYVMDNLCLDHLDTYETKIKSIIGDSGTYSDNFLAIPSTHRTMSTLHTLDEFQSLANQVMENAKIFLTEMGYAQEFVDRVNIGNMWANIGKQNDFVGPHVHPGSIISGVFYVKKYEGSKINFFNDIHDTILFEGEYNHLSFPHCSYDCEPGRMILFKSNVLHSTERQTSGEKISISFNIDIYK